MRTGERRNKGIPSAFNGGKNVGKEGKAPALERSGLKVSSLLPRLQTGPAIDSKFTHPFSRCPLGAKMQI